MYRALVLFDIDGTLVRRAGPHHRAALVEGVRKVAGLKTTTEGIPVQGMLDPDILAIMMRKAGATRARIRETMPEIVRAAERYYLRVCPMLGDSHCPGVPALLERLARHEILLGLVTGNLTRIGWHKLERAGLRGTSVSERSARRPRRGRGWRARRFARRAGGAGSSGGLRCRWWATPPPISRRRGGTGFERSPSGRG